MAVPRYDHSKNGLNSTRIISRLEMEFDPRKSAQQRFDSLEGIIARREMQ